MGREIKFRAWRQAAALGKNQLKAKQRQALNNLANKWGVKL